MAKWIDKRSTLLHGGKVITYGEDIPCDMDDSMVNRLTAEGKIGDILAPVAKVDPYRVEVDKLKAALSDVLKMKSLKDVKAKIEELL